MTPAETLIDNTQAVENPVDTAGRDWDSQWKGRPDPWMAPTRPRWLTDSYTRAVDRCAQFFQRGPALSTASTTPMMTTRLTIPILFHTHGLRARLWTSQNWAAARYRVSDHRGRIGMTYQAGGAPAALQALPTTTRTVAL